MSLQALSLVVHCDWSKNENKRWMACAKRHSGNRWTACAPEPVGEVSTLLKQLTRLAGQNGSTLVGFDFPIGLPLAYAQRAGINDFLTFLPRFGHDVWETFYMPAEEESQISLQRPFYPAKLGNAKQAHLYRALGVNSINDLRRRCELARPGRRAACPLFWTMGAQQVGKAAIHGWQYLLTPAIGDTALDLVIWPFSGTLKELCRPGRIVVAETYPAEFYVSLNLSFGKTSKRDQNVRQAKAPLLFDWAARQSVELQPTLQAEIATGFGEQTNGEDRFDAVVGLFGMLDSVQNEQAKIEPKDAIIFRIEGWILGQPWPVS